MGLFDGVYNTFNKLTTDAYKKAFGGTSFAQIDQMQLQKMKNDPNIDKNVKELALNFFEIGENKAEFIKQLDNIKNFYFTQLIIDRIIEDGLNPTNGKDLFKVKVKDSRGEKDEVASEFLMDFVDTMNLKKIITDISHDILLYGEYALRIDVNSYQSGEKLKGIINIHDDVDIANLLPVYNDGEISYFLTVKDKKLETVQPTEYVYFSLPGNRLKMKFEGLDNKVLHLRMGKSVVYPVLGLIKELKFLEEIIPQQFINNLVKTKLLGVSVPNKTKPSDAMEIASVFQRMINKTLTKTNVKDDEEEILRELRSKVGDIKVMPMFGDKGSIETIDFGENDNFDDVFEKIMDIRKNIFLTIGIPTSILDEDGSKGEMIKDHIRYTKKLKSIQYAIQDGLQTMFYIHLVNNGFTNYLKEDIDINFLNILNTDDLERLEYIDIMISMMDNFKSFVEDFEDSEYAEVNWPDIVKFYNSNFENLTGFSLFTLKENTGENDDF